MAQEKQKENLGFFSVLLGRGAADLKGETRVEDEKRPFNEGRVAAPNSRPSAAARQLEQHRSLFASDSRASPRSSMTKDTRRSNTNRDSISSRPERASRRQREVQPTRPSIDSRPSSRFVDASEAPDSKDTGEVRAARKVAFNTPPHSLRKGRTVIPRLEEAGSSSDSSAPHPAPRPKTKPSKPSHVRGTSKSEVEERNWNSSTATLQDKEESRPLSGKKNRPLKSGNYPLTKTLRPDGFHAVRVSGPDRVVIAPNSTAGAGHRQTDRPFVPVSSTAAQRRPAPTPNMPLVPPMTKRVSQDINRSGPRPRPVDPQRSRLHRDRQSNGRVDGERMQSIPHNRPNKAAARSATSIRPMPPMPDMPTSTLLSQNMARARAGERNAINSYNAAPNGLHHATGTMPQSHDRPPNARTRIQRA